LLNYSPKLPNNPPQPLINVMPPKNNKRTITIFRRKLTYTIIAFKVNFAKPYLSLFIDFIIVIQ
jgi:hypothetical protein